ncbi:pH-response regulator protein palA/rim20 [Scheffersomyces spartinae]|uniref:PH-response regulator protein palA/rim20 n=1 Tax=Scheffersomyces spartinae TaxID=45513 RepID=A0A9P8AGL2_9ASCO|nr:pH-response regulator protein palA/rim20 [Scheffersomyces spartinae]KAG7191726.1 pH-response regulator protein palA/rim20 [Scheffersomyces spartinae]
MNTNLIHIPLRKTAPVDIGEAIGEIIEKEFQRTTNYEADLVYISGLRFQVLSLQDEAIHIKDIDTLLQYYSQLDVLIDKFLDDFIELTWFGTLGHGTLGLTPSITRSLMVEKLNVLYQCGSIYSQLALLESRYSELGLKKLCQYFQLASGCFDHISVLVNSSRKVGYIPTDFLGDTIQCLKWIMLAQAQEKVWQKALLDDTMKNTIIARLSKQISDYYSQALELAHKSRYIRIEWMNHLTVKMLHFKAAAYYRMAKVSLDNYDYGVQVGLLRVAKTSCEQAIKSKKYVSNYVIEDLNGITETVLEAYRVADKENDLIYMNIVPEENDLSPIQGAPMVKCLDPPFVDKPTKQIFTDLLPYIVVQARIAYRDREKWYLTTTFEDAVRMGNELIVNYLTERNIQATLNLLQEPERIPESIIENMDSISKRGGSQGVHEGIHQRDQQAGFISKILDSCKERLEIDNQEDELFRQQYISNSNLDFEPTSDAAKELIAKVNKVENYIIQANKGDNTVNMRFKELTPVLRIYEGGIEALHKYIPDASLTNLDPKVAEIVNNLNIQIHQYKQLQDERQTVYTKAIGKSKSRPIANAITSTYKADPERLYKEDGTTQRMDAFEDIFERHLQIYNPEVEELKAIEFKQKEFEQRLDYLSNKLKSKQCKIDDNNKSERQRVLETLDKAYAKFLELNSNLDEGIKFYNAFTDKVNTVLIECTDFLETRRAKRIQYEDEIVLSQDNSIALPPTTQVPKPRNGIWDSNAMNIRYT